MLPNETLTLTGFWGLIFFLFAAIFMERRITKKYGMIFWSYVDGFWILFGMLGLLAVLFMAGYQSLDRLLNRVVLEASSYYREAEEHKKILLEQCEKKPEVCLEVLHAVERLEIKYDIYITHWMQSFEMVGPKIMSAKSRRIKISEEHEVEIIADAYHVPKVTVFVAKIDSDQVKEAPSKLGYLYPEPNYKTATGNVSTVEYAPGKDSKGKISRYYYFSLKPAIGLDDFNESEYHKYFRISNDFCGKNNGICKSLHDWVVSFGLAASNGYKLSVLARKASALNSFPGVFFYSVRYSFWVYVFCVVWAFIAALRAAKVKADIHSKLNSKPG